MLLKFIFVLLIIQLVNSLHFSKFDKYSLKAFPKLIKKFQVLKYNRAPKSGNSNVGNLQLPINSSTTTIWANNSIVAINVGTPAKSFTFGVNPYYEDSWLFGGKASAPAASFSNKIQRKRYVPKDSQTYKKISDVFKNPNGVSFGSGSLAEDVFKLSSCHNCSVKQGFGVLDKLSPSAKISVPADGVLGLLANEETVNKVPSFLYSVTEQLGLYNSVTFMNKFDRKDGERYLTNKTDAISAITIGGVNPAHCPLDKAAWIFFPSFPWAIMIDSITSVKVQEWDEWMEETITTYSKLEIGQSALLNLIAVNHMPNSAGPTSNVSALASLVGAEEYKVEMGFHFYKISCDTTIAPKLLLNFTGPSIENSPHAQWELAPEDYIFQNNLGICEFAFYGADVLEQQGYWILGFHVLNKRCVHLDFDDTYILGFANALEN